MRGIQKVGLEKRDKLRVTREGFLLAGVVLASGSLVAQTTVPDSQVEANVLKAFAGAPELASEAITTRTVYGTVTLSGSVRDEQVRRKAETLASNADGVKKVVDELRLSGSGNGSTQQTTSQPVPSTEMQAAGAQPLVLQSDGTYAPASAVNQEENGAPISGAASASQAQRNNPEADQELDRRMEQQGNQTSQFPAQNGQPQVPAGQPPYQQYPSYPQQGPYARRPLNAPYPSGSYPQYACTAGHGSGSGWSGGWTERCNPVGRADPGAHQPSTFE